MQAVIAVGYCLIIALNFSNQDLLEYLERLVADNDSMLFAKQSSACNRAH